MPEGEARPTVNPQALAIPDAARLLSKIGGRLVTEAMLWEPTCTSSRTGTLNLTNYRRNGYRWRVPWHLLLRQNAGLSSLRDQLAQC